MGNSNSNCEMACDECPMECTPNPPPPPIITPKFQNVGQSSGGVWDTTLDRQDIQPLHY